VGESLAPTSHIIRIKAIGARMMISPEYPPREGSNGIASVLLDAGENTYATMSFLGKASGRLALPFAVTATSTDIP
jgi:hypothetical protein